MKLYRNSKTLGRYKRMLWHVLPEAWKSAKSMVLISDFAGVTAIHFYMSEDPKVTDTRLEVFLGLQGLDFKESQVEDEAIHLRIQQKVQTAEVTCEVGDKA